MEIKSLQRAFLLFTGVAAVMVILLSQAVYTTGAAAKAKPEKSKDKKEVTIQAPSDVAAQGQAVDLSTTQPAMLKEITRDENQHRPIVFVQKIATDFFKTLFRVIISPNAP